MTALVAAAISILILDLVPRAPPAAGPAHEGDAAVRARRDAARRGAHRQHRRLRVHAEAAVLRLLPRDAAVHGGRRRSELEQPRRDPQPQPHLRRGELLQLPRRLPDVRRDDDEGERPQAPLLLRHRVRQHRVRTARAASPSTCTSRSRTACARAATPRPRPTGSGTEDHAGMLDDIRKGDAKCIDCHSGEKIHPRAFAHGGNGRGAGGRGRARRRSTSDSRTSPSAGSSSSPPSRRSCRSASW